MGNWGYESTALVVAQSFDARAVQPFVSIGRCGGDARGYACANRPDATGGARSALQLVQPCFALDGDDAAHTDDGQTAPLAQAAATPLA